MPSSDPPQPSPPARERSGLPAEDHSLLPTPDHQLGADLRLQVADGPLDRQRLTSMVRDLVRGDQSLLAPLLHLVGQPAFIALDPSEPSLALRRSSRDRLLRELEDTYQPQLLTRLQYVLDAYLGLEPSLAAGPPEPTESPWAFWRSVLITLAVALGIRQFLLEARYIPSGSMLPGLQLQDRLLVEKVSNRLRPPRRGEIVVFHAPHRFDPVLSAQGRPSPLHCLVVNIPVIGSLPGLQNPACDAFIKRVVALPGERVSVDPRGRVRINGRALQEPYVRSYCPVDNQGNGPCRTIEAVVPPGTVLVLGDNRANSWDGRFWPGGHFLPRREIIGRAFWRFLPLRSWGSLGPTTPEGP